jgi:hypothetical protein
MFPVLRWAIGINKDVIDVDNEVNIKHIAENVIHETLKNSGTIGKAERHNLLLKQTITGLEGGLPFITFRELDQVICMLKVNLCIKLLRPTSTTSLPRLGEVQGLTSARLRPRFFFFRSSGARLQLIGCALHYVLP